MSFTISLSRNLKENEFIKVTIPKIGNNEAKTYMFLHSSSTDWKVGDGIEYIFGSSTTYTYSWSDLEFANLNLLIAWILNSNKSKFKFVNLINSVSNNAERIWICINFNLSLWELCRSSK